MRDNQKNSKDRTHPVGEKLANAFGLFDMSGNVLEWTASEYEDKYRGKEIKILNKSNVQNMLPVLRGDSWNFSTQYLRSANRGRSSAVKRYFFIGFRLVRM